MSAPAAGRGIAPTRVRPGDLLRLGSVGLATRRLRAALSALGIAIGIASMVAVLGISESSKADLIAQLDRLGTNLLRVTPGQSLLGEEAELPKEAAAMIRRIAPVEQVAAVEALAATVRRSERIPEEETGGIAVQAADTSLLATLGASMRSGRWLTTATGRYPTVVLGATAAERLGISRVYPGLEVWLGGRRFVVVGILDPVPLAPELDRTALVGREVARRLLGAQGSPSTIYLRAHPETIEDVRGVLPATANPRHAEEVQVSRPSDAIAARAAAKSAFTSLFLGLGAVVLLVGGIGIANVMVIGVLERRSEIGLRRALGATGGHIRLQFLSEALLLATLGGLAGVALGALVSAGYARSRDWSVVIPVEAVVGGLVAALAIGAVAGLYPAVRAARLAPTEALRTT
jgi:putative ABC transport system permease protein